MALTASVAVVFGNSTAGGAYVPGMSDYVVLQKDAARVYLGGPPLVKMAIDEDADDESLGGAEMHASVTGLGEYLSDNDAHAIAMCRDDFGYFGPITLSTDRQPSGQGGQIEQLPATSA